MSSKKIVAVTDDSFEKEVINATLPVLVDFWAEWCGPCKMIAPLLDDIANDYDERLKIAKVNIDENAATPQKFGVRGIPTLMLFKKWRTRGYKSGCHVKISVNCLFG